MRSILQSFGSSFFSYCHPCEVGAQFAHLPTRCALAYLARRGYMPTFYPPPHGGLTTTVESCDYW